MMVDISALANSFRFLRITIGLLGELVPSRGRDRASARVHSDGLRLAQSRFKEAPPPATGISRLSRSRRATTLGGTYRSSNTIPIGRGCAQLQPGESRLTGRWKSMAEHDRSCKPVYLGLAQCGRHFAT